MKILLTGFTQRMVNSTRLRYDYLTSVFVLRQALEELGHAVDHRAVTWGEDLSRYDRALVGVGPTKSFTARFVPGAAWVFDHELPVTLYADDWSIEKTGADFRNTLRRWDAWKKFYLGCGPVRGQELAPAEESIRALLTTVVDSGNLRLLAPLFPWGNHGLLVRQNLDRCELRAWDPTPLLDRSQGDPPKDKERRWVLATLQQQSRLPDRGEWPWLVMGNKRTGQAYLPEREVLQRYGASRGVICPAYARAGSGWWRARYQHAADAGCVLWLDARDQATVGEPYQHRLRDYERMDGASLATVTDDQREWFYANTATRAQTLNAVQEAVR